MKQKLHFVGNRCVLFITLLTLTLTSYSQLGPIDAGFTIGPSNFLGDLGGNYGKGRGFIKDNNFSMTRVFVGVHLTANPSEYISLRLAANYGNIAGDDAVINGKGGYEEARLVRNLNFKSRIMEGLLLAELYPLVILEEDPTDTWHKIRPYGVIGVGYFTFNPQGQDPTTGGWVYLKPLHTEGQGFPEYPDRKEYALHGMNIPMGFGAKYYASDNMTLSFEIVHRKTFTDYIDDVSTRYIDPSLFYTHLPTNRAIVAERLHDKRLGAGNRIAGKKRGDANKDAFYSIGLKASFRLGGGNNGYRNSTRCPVMRY